MILVLLQSIQQNIESRSKLICGLLKLCEHLQTDNKVCPSEIDIDSIQKIVVSLERRWHTLWLQSLEHTFRLEQLIREKRVISYLAFSVKSVI